MKTSMIKSKSGFTLLEVLLAVAILVMASTMIMKGFITVMIIANNNSRYAKSGEDNYRRAMSETIARFATASDQQTAMDELSSNNNSVLLNAHFDNPAFEPQGMEPVQLNLVVDASVYADYNSPLFSENGEYGSYTVSGDSQALESSTVVNNRFAFFYDFNDYIDVVASDSELSGSDKNDDCIIRWGYTIADEAPSGQEASCIDNPNGDGVLVYGWYCFNSRHVSPESQDEDGNVIQGSPEPCTYIPVAYGRVPQNATLPSEDENNT